MSQLTPTYNPVGGLSAVDQILLRGARSHKSPNELSELTNGIVTPAQASVRVIDILASRDWLSQSQQRMLIIDDLMALKDSLTESAIEYNSLEHVKPLIQVLNTLAKVLTEDKLDIKKAMAEISRAQSQIMLEGISLALERSFMELEKRYPEISKEELLNVFHVAMPEAVLAIEGKIAKE